MPSKITRWVFEKVDYFDGRKIPGYGYISLTEASDYYAFTIILVSLFVVISMPASYAVYTNYVDLTDNQKPSAELTVESIEYAEGVNVTLSAAQSSDDKQGLEYTYKAESRVLSERTDSPTISYTAKSPGEHNATVVVYDSNNQTDSASKTVNINTTDAINSASIRQQNDSINIVVNAKQLLSDISVSISTPQKDANLSLVDFGRTAGTNNYTTTIGDSSGVYKLDITGGRTTEGINIQPIEEKKTELDLSPPEMANGFKSGNNTIAVVFKDNRSSTDVSSITQDDFTVKDKTISLIRIVQTEENTTTYINTENRITEKSTYVSLTQNATISDTSPNDNKLTGSADASRRAIEIDT
jgi:hypothetical protein